MKKINKTTVGYIWSVLLLLVTIGYLLTIMIGNIGLMPILTAGAIVTIVIGVPYLFTWVWNKFVTEEENGEEG